MRSHADLPPREAGAKKLRTFSFVRRAGIPARVACAAPCAALACGAAPALYVGQVPVLRPYAARARHTQRHKYANEPRSRKVCGIKLCYHGPTHRPATQARDAVLKGFQPLFRIFLEDQCCHFLDGVIKSAICWSGNAAVPADPRFQMC